mmetsp:Transcript_88560/g.235680  ORF Transcript_88560/g.235680 Transcript_88560/m.235680 type:complete len:377 (-) Transcript_88560:2826-3956(-)
MTGIGGCLVVQCPPRAPPASSTREVTVPVPYDTMHALLPPAPAPLPPCDAFDDILRSTPSSAFAAAASAPFSDASFSASRRRLTASASRASAASALARSAVALASAAAALAIASRARASASVARARSSSMARRLASAVSADKYPLPGVGGMGVGGGAGGAEEVDAASWDRSFSHSAREASRSFSICDTFCSCCRSASTSAIKSLCAAPTDSACFPRSSAATARACSSSATFLRNSSASAGFLLCTFSGGKVVVSTEAFRADAASSFARRSPALASSTWALRSSSSPRSFSNSASFSAAAAIPRGVGSVARGVGVALASCDGLESVEASSGSGAASSPTVMSASATSRSTADSPCAAAFSARDRTSPRAASSLPFSA